MKIKFGEYIHLNIPKPLIPKIDDFDNTAVQITNKAMIKAVEQINDAIFNEIVAIARSEGIDDIYLLDKKNILFALEKQIPKKHFKNECECIVDYEILYNAIDNKCKSENCYFHNEYRIVLRNCYPSVCINRQWHYVHILIGEFIYGRIRKGYIIHHKDKNKLNAMPDNLELMTNLKHLKMHGVERKGKDFRSAEGKLKCVNSAREVRMRKDVTVEKVIDLRNKGLTIPEIAKELNCGINTVNRRLSKSLDWGDE